MIIKISQEKQKRRAATILAFKTFFEKHKYKDFFNIWSNGLTIEVAFKENDLTNYFLKIYGDPIYEEYFENGVKCRRQTDEILYKVWLSKSVHISVLYDYDGRNKWKRSIRFSHDSSDYFEFKKWEEFNWGLLEKNVNKLIHQVYKVRKKDKQKGILKKIKGIKKKKWQKK